MLSVHLLLHSNINMHILRNVYCTLLKRRQGQSVENKIRASLVGDHFIDSCELHMFDSEGSMG